MIVVLIGAPGAGKGTQADLLAARDGYRKLSTGDALRRQVKLGTEIGRKAGAIMERGELVPDDVLLGIVKAELESGSRDDVILLDGYPRNLAQAEALDGLRQIHAVKGALHLDVERTELIERLSGRLVCSQCGATYHKSGAAPKKAGVCDRCGGGVSQRADDRAESVAVRLDVFEKNTKPVLDYYKRTGVYRRISGQGSQEAIYTELRKVIKEG